MLVEVKSTSARRTRGGKALVTCDVSDGSARMRLTFFNQSWRERQLRPEMQVLVFGKLDVYQGRKQMTNPVVDLVGDRTGKLIPVYPQSDKARVYTWDIASLARRGARAGRRVRGARAVERARSFRLRRPHGRVQRHPPTRDHARAGRGAAPARVRRVVPPPARARAAQAGARTPIRGHRPRRRRRPGAHASTQRLPYELTGAQVRVIDEIERDLARRHPMHRLLQGDVGSGKTVVAVSALLVAVEGGHQGALMAPTEVLAEQHALGVRRAARRLHDARREPARRAAAAGRPAHWSHDADGAEADDGAARERRDRHPDRHPRADRTRGGVPLARGRRGRRAASVRGRAAGCAAGEGRRRCRARRARDDGDAHPAHRGDDGVRRSRRVDPRRAAAGTREDQDQLGEGEAGRAHA